MALTITEKKAQNGVLIISAEGFIDTSTSSELEDALKKAHAAGSPKIVVDLKGAEFISSSGWGALVAYLKRTRTAGGDIRLAAMVEKVDKVFRLMEFDSLIDAFPDTEAAVKSYGG